MRFLFVSGPTRHRYTDLKSIDFQDIKKKSITLGDAFVMGIKKRKAGNRRLILFLAHQSQA